MRDDWDFSSVEHLLPESARDLVELIGFDAAFRLIQKFGGTTFPSSRKNVRHNVLKSVVGDAHAETILQHCRDGASYDLYIPLCSEAMRELRDRMLRRDFDDLSKNMTADNAVIELALKYHLSDRHVFRILKKSDSKVEPILENGRLF